MVIYFLLCYIIFMLIIAVIMQERNETFIVLYKVRGVIDK